MVVIVMTFIVRRLTMPLKFMATSTMTISTIIAVYIIEKFKSDPFGTRTQDPHIKSVML